MEFNTECGTGVMLKTLKLIKEKSKLSEIGTLGIFNC
jgi:hypothetical protein